MCLNKVNVRSEFYFHPLMFTGAATYFVFVRVKLTQVQHTRTCQLFIIDVGSRLPVGIYGFKSKFAVKHAIG